MSITPLPPIPQRGDDPQTFSARADAFLGALPLLATEIDAASEQIESDVADALLAANTAQTAVSGIGASVGVAQDAATAAQGSAAAALAHANAASGSASAAESWALAAEAGIGYTTTVSSANKTLANREHCTVTGSGRTITLPAGPAAGWEVAVTVLAFSNTTIARNGQNIMSLAENLTVNVPQVTVTLRFIDATRGWRIV